MNVTNEISSVAWSTKRRIVTTLVLSGFIVLCSALIGTGFFTLSHYAKLTLDKKTILQQLLRDPQFVKAATKAAKTRTCTNNILKFEVNYLPLLHPQQLEGETACSVFTAVHPTGINSIISITQSDKSREELVLSESKYYSYVTTDLLNANNRTMSRISGVKRQVPTIEYIITGHKGSFIITYAPTSPTLNGAVESLAESLIFPLVE